MKLNWMMVVCVSVFTATAIMFFGPAPDVSVPAFQSQIAANTASDMAEIAPAAGETAEPAACAAFQSYVGKGKDTLLQADVEKAGLTLRLSAENAPLTRDFRSNRLTVLFDAANIITKIGCY